MLYVDRVYKESTLSNLCKLNLRKSHQSCYTSIETLYLLWLVHRIHRVGTTHWTQRKCNCHKVFSNVTINGCMHSIKKKMRKVTWKLILKSKNRRRHSCFISHLDLYEVESNTCTESIMSRMLCNCLSRTFIMLLIYILQQFKVD